MITVSSDAPDLFDLHAIPSVRAYLRRLWDYRWFVITQAVANVKVTTAGRVLGVAWLLVSPLLMAAVFLFVFGVVFDAGDAVEHFVGFLITGLLAFTFLTRAVTSGAGSITNNRPLIHELYFPRAALPVAASLSETLTFVVSLAIPLALTIIYGTLSPALLMLPIYLLLGFVLATSLATVASLLVNKLTDVQDGLPYLLQVWLYFSAVMYPRSFLDGKFPEWFNLILFDLNPGYAFMTLVRSAFGFQGGQDSLPRLLVSVFVWGAVGLVVAFRSFMRTEISLGQ